MTNDLEKQFFDTFGIEPIQVNKCSYINLRDLGLDYGTDICLHLEDENITCGNCENNKDGELLYPQITDRILLELICILHTTKLVKLCTTNVGDLKEEVLITLCCWVNHSNIKQQVQALFEEG